MSIFILDWCLNYIFVVVHTFWHFCDFKPGPGPSVEFEGTIHQFHTWRWVYQSMESSTQPVVWGLLWLWKSFVMSETIYPDNVIRVISVWMTIFHWKRLRHKLGAWSITDMGIYQAEGPNKEMLSSCILGTLTIHWTKSQDPGFCCFNFDKSFFLIWGPSFIEMQYQITGVPL